MSRGPPGPPRATVTCPYGPAVSNRTLRRRPLSQKTAGSRRFAQPAPAPGGLDSGHVKLPRWGMQRGRRRRTGRSFWDGVPIAQLGHPARRARARDSQLRCNPSYRQPLRSELANPLEHLASQHHASQCPTAAGGSPRPWLSWGPKRAALAKKTPGRVRAQIGRRFFLRGDSPAGAESGTVGVLPHPSVAAKWSSRAPRAAVPPVSEVSSRESLPSAHVRTVKEQNPARANAALSGPWLAGGEGAHPRLFAVVHRREKTGKTP
jgi:hypothetical protein